MKTAQILSGACLALLSVGGCLQVADIKERKFEPGLADGGAGNDAGDGGGGAQDAEVRHPDEDQCAEYCAEVKESCPAAFFADEYCPRVCPHFALSEGPDPTSGNTFECRLDQVKTAKLIGADDSREHCLRAGPGGDGVCGTNCESYCQLFSTICADYPQAANDCINQCKKLPSDPAAAAAEAFGANNDTIECRLAHLSAAAIAPDPHCEHASIYVDKHTPCYRPEPKCDEYCTLMQNVCTDTAGADGSTMQQYESFEDCRALCVNGLVVSEELLPTETQDKGRDTLACRRYHVYNHLLFGGSHCEHAGPGGDGHCGRICPAYCRLVKNACAGDYAARYENDEACREDCADVIDIEEENLQIDLHYNVETGKQGGDNIQCRLYHTTKAFRTPEESCQSALGLGACAP